MEASAFHTIAQKGFQIFYANGWGISVMFGYDNYCDNRDDKSILPWRENTKGFQMKTCQYYQRLKCANAEVAVFDNQGNMVNGRHWPHGTPHDDVAGHLTPDQVTDIMVWVQQQPAK